MAPRKRIVSPPSGMATLTANPSTNGVKSSGLYLDASANGNSTRDNTALNAIQGGTAVPDINIDHFAEYGLSGLKRMGGLIYEEFLPQLRNEKANRVYREMAENDPTISAVLFAIEMHCRMVDWRVDAASESAEDAKRAQHVRQCMDDMSHTWSDFISECLTMLPYGFAPHEIVYKMRRGPEQKDPSLKSRYDDGQVGWRKIPLRAQDTVVEWVFDEDGGVKGFYQRGYPDWKLRYIPIEKSLLFRTTFRKNNPEGHALALNTPVPTPDGWKTIEGLHPGDKIFDEQGKIRYVTAEKTWSNRPVYKLTFNDGTSIIADKNHEWFTRKQYDRINNHPGTVRTTSSIAATIKTDTGITNHAVPWSSAVEYPKQMLLLDPWYLGLWLGDGTSRTGDISCHVKDELETVKYIEQAGYTAKTEVNGGSANGRLIRVYGTRLALRTMDLKLNKHIPENYLRGSIQQRLDLLSGLMDSDGTVDKDGRCEFSNTNKDLIDGVAELVRSLGVSAKVALRCRETATHKTKYCVKFTPSFVPFKLERKAKQCKLIRARSNHYIVSAEKVANQTTKCIEVDSPSHRFLVGESFIQTHNSILRGAYRAWYFKKRMEEIEAIGAERDLAGLPMVTLPADIFNSTRPEDQAVLAAMHTFVKQVRNDERAGIVFPMAYDDAGNKIYDFSLVSTGGARTFDTSSIIQRYDERIAMTVLADFIFLGGVKGSSTSATAGSYAMSTDKTDMFKQALTSWLDSIADTFNRHAIPRLFELNHWPVDHLPKIAYESINVPNLDTIGAFISNMMAAGWADILSDHDLRNFLLKRAELPVPNDMTEDKDRFGDVKSGETPDKDDVVFAGPTGVVRIKPDGKTEVDTAMANEMMAGRETQPGAGSAPGSKTEGTVRPNGSQKGQAGGPHGPAKSGTQGRGTGVGRKRQVVARPSSGASRRPNPNERKR